jgi:hypothetical protein
VGELLLTVQLGVLIRWWVLPYLRVVSILALMGLPIDLDTATQRAIKRGLVLSMERLP